jgi:SHS2 domain-containing protein
MADWSDMFTGSIERLDDRTRKTNEYLERIIPNRDVDRDVVQMLQELHFTNAFQMILIKRLMLELDDMSYDIKTLQSHQK